MRKNLIVITGLILLLACPSQLFAQRISGSLRGTVTSSDTGATLPGAKVTARNVDTGLTRTATSNQRGNYSIGDLPVGTYQLTVEFPDFKSFVVTDIRLNVSDILEVNAPLEIGEIADEITVEAPSLQVETVGGEVATLISGEEVRELPLNGRNFTQLTQLMPGVSAPDGLDFKNKGLLSGVDTSVSGSSVTGNQWTVDGANNNDVGANRTILIYPSVEAIEEFKIHRNSYGPEFGGAGGAQINLITRGGTNEYKGSVFGFYRNDSLNEANSFLEDAGLEKEEIDRKDYGFTLGGPIIKDKLQFFISTEWNDETRGTVRSAAVPTLAERSGDFSNSSNPPVDPLTGQPFPGNIIPSDRLSEAGLALLDLYPAPTTNAAGNNWVGTVPTDIDWNQINARVDYQISESTRALIRYTEDDWDNAAPNAGETNGLWGDDPFPAVDSAWIQPGDSLVAQINHVFSGDAINTFTYSKSGNSISIEQGGDLALVDRLNSLIPPTFPEEGKLNSGNRAHPVYWGGATGRDLWNIAPWNNEQDLQVYKNDYEQVFGDHYVKAGVLYSDNFKLENCCGASAFESPHFWGGAGIEPWGATSGNRIADILLDGMYHGFDESASQPAPEMNWEDIEVYVGDSWKATDNLTLDFGVRYSYFKAPYAADNDIVSFVPGEFDQALGNASCNGVTQAPGTDPCGAAGLAGASEAPGRGLVEEDKDNFAPRVGVAWDVFGNGESVLRAGIGQFYQRERVNIQLDMAGQPPFTANTSGIRTFDNPIPDGGFSSGFGVPNRGIDPNIETPYNWQFNLTWEQRIGRNATLEVGYVGNRGRHLYRKSDINQVPAGDLNGNGVSDRLEFLRGDGDGNGSVRPFFTGGPNRILYWESNGESEYDSLQTQFQYRFGRGSQLQLSYTWSRFKANDSLTSSSAGEENIQITDRDNFDLDYGYAGLHRDHIFNASLIWNLPTLEGRGGIVEALFGNWTIGSVVSYASGTPITVYAIDIPGLGGAGFAGTGYDDNNRPLRVSNVSCSGSGSQIINPNAFTLSGIVLGDTSQMARRGACEGPDFFQVDLSFYKNIRLSSRFKAQVRVEIFNLTNEVNYIASSVENNIRPTNVVLDAPLDSATTIVSADFQDNFGQATASRDARQVQLGLKISF